MVEISSSLPTLDRIIERDSIDDLFRRELMWRKIAANLLGCLAGAGGAACSVSSLLETGIDFGHSLLGGVSLTVAGFSVSGLHKALKTRRDYFDEMKQGIQPDARPYFINGSISQSGTAVERSYGYPVKAVDSISCVRRNKGAPSGGIFFLDHVFVRDVNRSSFETTEFISTSEGTYDQQVTHHHGSFTLERLGERSWLSFSFKSSMSDDISRLLSLAGEELALLLRPYDGGSPDWDSPFSIYKIYHPHP